MSQKASALRKDLQDNDNIEEVLLNLIKDL
jgi:hypothetical protein